MKDEYIECDCLNCDNDECETKYEIMEAIEVVEDIVESMDCHCLSCIKNAVMKAYLDGKEQGYTDAMFEIREHVNDSLGIDDED